MDGGDHGQVSEAPAALRVRHGCPELEQVAGRLERIYTRYSSVDLSQQVGLYLYLDSCIASGAGTW